MNCFAVKLVDGTTLDMFDECNHVSYRAAILIKCLHLYHTTK